MCPLGAAEIPGVSQARPWALLSLARRQRPIYQGLLPPPRSPRDTQ